MEAQTVLSGWLAIDKPSGVSSSQVVTIIKHHLQSYKTWNGLKIGHAGTLDPFANGVLPIAIGEATKTINFVQSFLKEYIFDMQFGQQTDTLDPEGQIIQISQFMPSKKDIEDILPQFTGKIWQIPPCFSALKINGERAYTLAREGKKFELAKRQVDIYSLELLEFCFTSNSAKLKVTSGKGTYIRSLARDIAIALGSCAYVSSLRRIKVGLFCEETLILLENIEQIVHNGIFERKLLSVDVVLDDIPVLLLSKDKVSLIKNGQAVPVSDYDQCTVLLVKSNNLPIALGSVTNGYFKPTRVFNL